MSFCDNLRGVIFDFNGTLFFDTPKHELAWREYAMRLCGREVLEEEFSRYVHGRTNAEILKYFVGEQISADEIFLHSEAKEELYRELCLADIDSLQLAQGAEQLLDELKSRGIPMAIATSSGKTNSDFYVEQFGLNRWFDKATFVYNDGSFRSKPHPDIYLHAAKVIGVAPSDCTIFEDMPSGIEAARSAGAGRIIAVASALDREFLANFEGVDEVIGDYTEIKLI